MKPPADSPAGSAAASEARDPAPNRAGSPAREGAQVYASALQSAGGKLVEALRRESDPSSVGVALYASPPYDLQVPALPVSRLSITLTPARVSGGLEGERERSYESPRHALFLAPAGAAAHWRKNSPSRHLNLYFQADALADSGIGNDRVSLDDAPLLNAGVPGVRALADALLVELASGAAWSAEAADSLGRLLLIKVARQQARQRTERNPLTPQLLARLVDHVQAHLGERILVSDLAAVVGLSPNRFAHAYSARTGQSPHQFVLSQRLRQAEALLHQRHIRLAEVAAACGFASQQHLTQVMRKRLGVTPARLRQALQSPCAAAEPEVEVENEGEPAPRSGNCPTSV